MTGRRACRPVVVTGLGAITPSGLNAETLWRSVRGGRSAIDTLAGSEFDQLAVRIGGQVRGFDVSRVVPPALARKLTPAQHWAIAAADEALGQAGAVRADQAVPWPAHRTAVIVASGSGPVDAQQAATRALDARGPRAVPLSLALYGAADAAAALVSQRYGTNGPSYAISATCASGGLALGEALRSVRHGYLDAVVVVGMEDCLNTVNLASNTNLRSLATGYEGQPTAACRPFDRGRTGFVMSQGAAAIVVESAESAQARGAEVLAELAGFGASSDAHHPAAPHPEGHGAARAVRDCLEDAEARSEEVDHLNAHGTGTPGGDAVELLALETALGEHARRIPISATKSSTGHLLGAAGVVEALISVMSIRDGLVPPTLNLEDPEFPGWNFVRNAAQRTAPQCVLSTSFGFGGHNAAILLRAVRDWHREAPLTNGASPAKERT